MAILSLPDKALKLLRLTTSGAKLADKIEDAVDPQIARNAIAAAKRYLLGKPSQAAQRRAREQGESLRSAVGAKPRVKAPTPTVPVSRSSKPTTSRAGQAQNLANAQARSGISAAARQAARNATKPKGKKVTSSRTQGKGAPRSTLTSAAKKRASTPAKPGQESRAQGQQNLANAQAQSMISTAARRANPTGAARPQVRAGGGAGGKPPSKVAVGAGLGLVGGGIGAAALVAKKRAEQKQKEKAKASPQAKKAMNKAAAALSQSKIKNKPKPPFRNTNSRTTKALNQGLSAPSKPKFDPEGIKERLASRKTGELKTSLRAARAAGDLFYKNPKTGRKMAAVLASDLKPGQSLTQYINKKEGKTASKRRPRRKPTQKPRGL
tara:strand:+ start:42 stop:1181 length:1140 start_codon:yes stop_codon:yes gene_type:complete